MAVEKKPSIDQETKVAPMTCLLRSLIIGYFVIVVMLAFFQRKLLYPATRASSLPVAQADPQARFFDHASDVELTCDDQTIVRGWLLQWTSNDARRPIVLYLHGNGGNRSHRLPWYSICRDAGLDVLAIDYPGYGDSDGKPTEGGIEASCRAAVDYLLAKGYSADQIFLGGTSLGGAAAVYAAEYMCKSDNAPAGLFVTSTFSSMTEVASTLYWWLPVRAVLVDTFPSAVRIPHVTCPILIMHGDRDTLVDPRFGKRLFEAAPNQSRSGVPKKYVTLPGAGHNDVLSTNGDLIGKSLTQFVQQCQADGDDE